MKQCLICKQPISNNRELCRECMKKKQWDLIKWEEAAQIFSPRIVKVLQFVRIKLEKSPVQKGLYLYGPAGTGKTIYASAVLMELKRQSYLLDDIPYITGGFVNVLNLLEEIRASFDRNDSQTSQQIIEKYSQTDILILDDIGGQKVTDWVLNILLLIINNRYENLKLTIITSNSDLNGLAHQYGDDRIPSRIVEMCQIKHFTNKDYRIGK